MKTTTSSVPQVRRSRSGGRPATGHGKPLSKDQKAVLCQLARAAFDHQDRMGLVDHLSGSDSARFAAWRHEQQLTACGLASLTECGNNDFRPLRAHFLMFAGRDDKAFADHLRSGKVKDHGAPEDTHENRETFRAKITEELLAHGRRCDARSVDYDPAIAAHVGEKLITAGYITAIAKAKCQGRPLDDLTAPQLREILWTTRNRIAAREGRGSTQARNKSQRRP